MQQEDDAYQRHHGALFHERMAQGFDRVPDQRRAVIDRHDVHAFGQAAGNLADAPLDVFNDIERIAPKRCSTIPLATSPSPLSSVSSPPLIRPKLDLRHVLDQNRRAAIVLENDLCRSGMPLR